MVQVRSQLAHVCSFVGHAVIKAKDHISSLKLGLTYIDMDVWTSVGNVHTR